MGAAILLLLLDAAAVGLSMRHQHIAPDLKLFFMFGAGLVEMVRLLLAQVLWARE